MNFAFYTLLCIRHDIALADWFNSKCFKNKIKLKYMAQVFKWKQIQTKKLCKCAIISKKVLVWLRSVIVFHSSCFSSNTTFRRESVGLLPFLLAPQPQNWACCWLYTSEIQTITFNTLKTILKNVLAATAQAINKDWCKSNQSEFSAVNL